MRPAQVACVELSGTAEPRRAFGVRGHSGWAGVALPEVAMATRREMRRSATGLEDGERERE